MTEKPQLTDLVQTSLANDAVKNVVDEYHSFHAGTVETRKANYTKMVNDYYDLVTDFYEFGWGQSFHFAPRHKGESFDASLARHEFNLALRLGLKPGMKVLDVGCGIGGPMRAIARFSGATIVGVNNNDYQIKRGTKQNADAGLADRCSFMKADFMKLPVPDKSYDGVYAIEATCHAPDKVKLFTELFRVMKDGAEFAGYEWCLTKRYDAGNPEHRAIKKGIEEGDALPDIWYEKDVVDALKQSGFEVINALDMAPQSDHETPWYLPLSGKMSLQGFKHTEIGRLATNALVRVLEATKVAPKGSTAVSSFLNAGAKALVRGGETGIFTPMFFFHVRKPASSKA
ncbi:MAG TPA: methyltransferase domain-containing protein [Polyangiaceae bacterium]|nr:methyltransferase domain-containing protein [Polyangiaceae bacterium]